MKNGFYVIAALILIVILGSIYLIVFSDNIDIAYAILKMIPITFLIILFFILYRLGRRYEKRTNDDN